MPGTRILWTRPYAKHHEFNHPPHLELDKNKLTAKVVGGCEREWVALEINELLVVEYYSRKV